jgi:hypothetical protein
MWDSRSESEVTCIACGEEVPRSAAREYDKYGDRWKRRDKEFEYLCKPCDQGCCHQPREGLETTLVRAGAGTCDDATFLGAYHDLTTEGREPGREPERE